jgi:propionyl-CoA carboxylase alpha chain
VFKKILIANRGEIACRVMRTARTMGIKTVAVYSEADADAVHTRMADEAVAIGPAASAESYLVIDKIMAAIRDTGAEAVHPGYGFLSENAEFARALEAAGVAFIGPNVEAIGAMGDKIESKKLAQAANVSTVPGHIGEIADDAEAAKIAGEIGYPVMIKASAGGGGKGMRVAWSEEEVAEGFRLARNEAASSFGDDRIFIEKFIEEPRHIEIQVLADSHGNTIHLGERECSIQRRHQKVIEESPSPFLDAETRAAMGAQAIALAEAVNYRSAGTVEFIVDRDRNFFFLEMNTRLQVEHPVTEMVTGIDLVEQMIRVAAGETLSIRQEDVTQNGWSMEVRVYAEDPLRNFLPSIGRLRRYVEPEQDERVRVDTGVEEGAEISMFYDPMIAKLVTWGETRGAAIDEMNDALDAYFIRGVQHNMGFVGTVLRQDRYREGRLTTNYIAEEFPDGFAGAALSDEDMAALAAVAASVQMEDREKRGTISGQANGGLARADEVQWDVWLDDRAYGLVAGGESGSWLVAPADGDAEAGSLHVTTGWSPGQPLFRAEVGGRQICVQVEREGAGWRLGWQGASVLARVMTGRTASLFALMPVKEPPDLSKFLLSPMPGLLVSVSVTVKEVRAGAGDSLTVDQAIIEFE